MGQAGWLRYESYDRMTGANFSEAATVDFIAKAIFVLIVVFSRRTMMFFFFGGEDGNAPTTIIIRLDRTSVITFSQTRFR